MDSWPVSYDNSTVMPDTRYRRSKSSTAQMYCGAFQKDCHQSAWSALNFKDAASIADYFMEEMRHLEQEQMILLMLDTKMPSFARQSISKGSVNCSVITPREIFLLALQHHAVFIILLHNHPSGDPTRVKRTKALQKGFHLAVSWSGYVFWIILLLEIGVMPVSGK